MVKKTATNDWAALKEKLAEKENLAIAFSGGADSSLLLAAASYVLPGKVKAYTCITPLMPKKEEKIAAEIAEKLQVPWQPLYLNNLSLEQIANNAPDRCYHCKKFLYTHILQQAQKDGLTTLAEGVNLSDHGEYRPGLKAAAELGVFQPFVELGWQKAQIRELLLKMNLEIADRPPSPCLASRFPYGEQLNPIKIEIIATGENLLHLAGFADCRIRQHGKLARIEVPIEQMPQLLAQREYIVSRLLKLGFQHICLDLAGRVSGSMDYEIKNKE